MEEEDRGSRGQGLAGPAVNLPECPAVEDREEDDGFSFPVPPLDTDACIVPVYPVFGRPPFPQAAPPPAGEEEEADEPETATLRVPLGRLLLEEREFRAARQQQDGRSVSARHGQEEDNEEEEEDDADEELEGVPPETYCLWAPGGGGSSAPASPRPRCRKSGSTGSVLRWRRISDRLVGRSHSDGKEKFVFLDAPGALHPPTGNKPDEQVGSGKGDAAAAGGVGRPLMYYGRGGGSGRRRSYLPYKQELVGLFANVSGLRRSYHPF
ncbi:hypothetical protein PR202_gb05299 [Eleusine coracana subsp. coracana]|uniref:Uncharacterized protein n=1 Tax=Eleusine coracana subsp. coracana TaxID=191504 RepID=A0AAV5E7J6_ELECO|nr:hypothetical protein PR202_gb05299 [Eleusine coracana subsp. coracana]